MTTTTEADVAVDFVAPMPGLSPYTTFTLAQIPGTDGLYALRATDAEVRLFLLDPRSGDYGYAPRIPDDALAGIGDGDGSASRVFVVANPADDGVYLNLRAPIVMHRETGRAAQVILEDQAYPIRALLGA